MGLFDNYRIKKSIETLLSLQNPASAKGTQAITTLKQIGRPAVSKLIEALGTAPRHQERLVSLLTTFLDNDTLPVYLSALTSAVPRVTAGIVDVLGRSTTYDPNRLLTLFANPKVSKADLEKLLLTHKCELDPNALLRQLTASSQDDATILFRILDQVATEATIPEMVHRLRSEEWAVRFHITRILSRFRTPAVRDTLVKLLTDSHKNVRLVALSGLAAMRLPFDVGPLCPLLHDPEAMVRGKATEVLLDFLQDASDDVRRKAAEGLSTVGDAAILRTVLGTLKDKEWWVTVRVTDALGTNGGVKLVQSVLTLLKDPDPFIRQSAFEIIHTMKDERAFRYLMDVLKDKDVREEAIEALVALGDKRAIPVFLNLLEGDVEAKLIAIRALVPLGEAEAIHPLRALAMLTNEAFAPDVLQAIMAVRDSAEGELRELANKMATTIIKRFGQKVMPRGVLAETAASVSSYEGLAPAATAVQVLEAGDAGTSVSPYPSGSGAIDVTTLEPGVVLIDRYRVIRRVGQGSFSVVFLVDDTMVHEDVILKILNPQVALDDHMIKRFMHELRYARKVTHENVIRIFDFIALGRSHAISMEYFEGHSLAEELKGRTPLNTKRGIKVIWDICRGVGAAHQVNVVHRDLKPPNILINDQGLVKIVDFGVAAVTSDMGTRLTRVGTLLGTPTYMAPEQVRSRTIDSRTDIYSLGVIMYEVFTGRPPYTGEDMAVLFQHVEGKPTPPRELNPDLPPALEGIILKAMAVDPEQRFQNIEALRKSLVEFSRQK
jgi:HEAT repeat protein/tRNA A-37 threonylcarbamoyl transferase component Bud32